MRFRNPTSLDDYLKPVEGGRKGMEVEALDARGRARERLMLDLWLLEGIETRAFEEETGFSIEEIAGRVVQEMVDDGFLRSEAGRIALTRKALPVADAVLVELF